MIFLDNTKLYIYGIDIIMSDKISDVSFGGDKNRIFFNLTGTNLSIILFFLYANIVVKRQFHNFI